MSRHLLVRAHAAFVEGRYPAALRDVESLLVADPRHLEALSIKVNAAMRLDDADALLDGLRRLHALRPDDVAIRRNLATTLNRRGNRALEQSRYAEAESEWRAALTVQPDHREARFNLAGWLRRTGHWADALSIYESLEHESPDPAVNLAIADCLTMTGRHDEAASRLRKMALDEDVRGAAICIAARCNAIDVAVAQLDLIEDVDLRVDAIVAAQRDAVVHRYHVDALLDAATDPARLGRRSPELQIAMTRAMALPDSLLSVDEIDALRERFGQGLQQLVETFDEPRLGTCEPRIAQVIWSNFLLAYHGRDDRRLQSQFGDWMHLATAVLGRELPRLPERRRNGRTRVGLVSGNWYHCTVGSYFGHWIEVLARMDIDLHLVQFGPREDGQTRTFAARVPHFHLIGPDLEGFIAQVRALDLDLAIFPELGMDQRLFTAAAAGLARQQWMAWGHPVTSGLPLVSHYLSCGDMEPANATSAYRESLLPLPGLGTRFELPERPQHRARSELGMPAGPLAIVPQSIFKVLPHNDAIYARLLDARGDLRIAFFGAGPGEDAARFRRRLSTAVGARAAERLLFLPELSRTGYLETLGACDLMIDTLGWSGGNSALDALRMGLPIVTTPGEFMRGRQCATMLRLLGIEGAEATSSATLAELALQRIGDDGFRQEFQSRVARGLQELVNDPACDRALMTHIENAIVH
jgi:predicted O-linked N-acetylglucosamine transferase (SPINDLY family)